MRLGESFISTNTQLYTCIYRDNGIMSTRGWVEGSWLETKSTCINFERKDFTRWHENHQNNIATYSVYMWLIIITIT